MARVRHTRLTLLALLGVLVAIQPTSARVACPIDTVATMPMMHHHSPAPASQLNCPVCLGVLASLPIVEPHLLLPATLFIAQPHTLLGIDPSLDPPPPRGA